MPFFDRFHDRRGRGLRLGAAGALVTATLAVPVLLAQTVAPAVAAPGSPGTPSDPVTVYTENFENVTAANQAQFLTSYVGTPPLGMTYTAHPAWISGPACNGVITSYNSTPNGTCSTSIFNTWVRPLAKGLGDRFGGGANNHVMSDVTVSGYPAPSTPAATLETARPVPLVVSNRFLAFSVDVAATSCTAAVPKLRFFLLDGSSAITLNDAAINPCTLPGGQNMTVDGRPMRVGSFATDNSLLFSGSDVGIRLTNDQTSGSGNDYAIDNVRILDATPQLDKTFESREYPFFVGETANLTFTVTNTSELAAKTGWRFTDALPAGLTIAGAATTTCAAGDLDAPLGGTTFRVQNGSISAGASSCTITVPVTSQEPGTFTNGPSNVTTTGLNPPGTSSIAFADPHPTMTLVKEGALQDQNGNDLADPGEQIKYTFTVTNTGNTPLSGVSIGDPRVGPTSPASQNVPIGGIRTFSSSYTVTQADVDAGSVPNTAIATGTGPLGKRVSSNVARNVVPTPDRDPRLTIDKTSALDDTNDNGVADVGEEITYSFDVRNTGNVTIDHVTVDDSRVQSTTPASATLVPGQQRTFVSSPYPVTQADVNTGQVYNAATAQGTSPTGPVESAPDEDRVDTPQPDPGITLEKSGSVLDDKDGDGRADVGDVVGYTFTVKNIGNVDLTGVTVDDARVHDLTPGSASVGAGDTQVFHGTYTVTQEDQDLGVVRNTATARGTYASPDGPVDVASPAATAEVRTPERAPALTIVKHGVLDDTNGNDRADVGETIAFSFDVTNTGNTTLESVRVQDERVLGLSPRTVTLAPAGSRTFTADPYPVTQADVDAGKVTNVATARGNVPGGAETTSDPDSFEVKTVDPSPSLTIRKTAVLEDTNANGTADAGEKIVYTFVITNTGNVTMFDVTVHDDRISGLVPPSLDALAPGASAQLVSDPYLVTAADVAAGPIKNVATAAGTPPGSEQAVISPPDQVTTSVTAVTVPVDDGGSPGSGATGTLPEVGLGGSVLWMGLLGLCLTLAGVGAMVPIRRSRG